MFTTEEEAVVEMSGGRSDVAVQWERPEQQWKDVGVQSAVEHVDVAVQVDLIGLSYRMPGSGDVPWQCVSVRADSPTGGALWQHCCGSSPLPSSALLCPSPTRTADQAPVSTQNPTLPSMHQSTVPSMPLCGNSPTASDKFNPEMLEGLGFMAPLSSDEEELKGKQSHKAIPTVKRRRGRQPSHKNAQSSSDTESKKHGRKNKETNEMSGREDLRPRRKTTRLPLRYQLDYDLDSHEPLPATQEPESAVRVEQDGAKEEDSQQTGEKQTGKKMLFLPYYKKSLNLTEFAELQNLSKQQSGEIQTGTTEWKGEMNPPIVMCPGFEQFMPCPLPLDKTFSKDIKNKKPQSFRVEVVKDESDVKPCPLALNSNSDLIIENVKEEEVEHEYPEKVIKKEKEKLGDVKPSNTSPDWSKYKRIVIQKNVMEESLDSASDQSDSWNKVLKVRQKEKTFVKQSIQENEKGESAMPWHGGVQQKRRRRRPKKDNEVEQYICKTKSRPASSEQLDRPRRTAVGPPIRYLLESEELESSPEGHRGRQRKTIPEWGEPLEDEDENSSEMMFGFSEDGESVLGPGRSEQTLDVSNDCEVEGGLVKRVKISNSESVPSEILLMLKSKNDPQWTDLLGQEAQMERGSGLEKEAEITYEYEDIENLCVPDKERRDGGKPQPKLLIKRDKRIQRSNLEHNKISHGVGRRHSRGAAVDLRRVFWEKALVHHDVDTGVMTFVPPCFIRLQQLT